VHGSAILQTIWTLRREIPYARRYGSAAGRAGVRGRLRAGLAQPVGHGLFLPREVLDQLGGLPETTVLDDVPTGFPLTLLGIPMVSVPRLANVPAAATVTEVIAQGRRWFCSYLDYPSMARADRRSDPIRSGHRRFLCLVAAYRGCAWLAASPVTALGLAAALSPRSGWRLRATASAGTLLATVVPVVMNGAAGLGPRTTRMLARDSGCLLAAYLLRSWGPWLAVLDLAGGRHPNSATALAPKAHHREGTAT
jgi:hypothetical protein